MFEIQITHVATKFGENFLLQTEKSHGKWNKTMYDISSNTAFHIYESGFVELSLKGVLKQTAKCK